jgi:phage nucleotide-binding protein
LRYNQGIKTIPPDEADNALFLGTALHTGLEKGVEEAIKEYYMQYPVITDAHINEVMKLEVMIPKAKEKIPNGEFEVNISDDDFVGFIDLLSPVTGFHGEIVPDVYDLYDFKYSNNVDKYKDSVQVHLYKYFFEKLNPGKKIRNMFYLCVPKVNIKQKKTENLGQFRQRIQEELTMAEPKLIPVEYDQTKVLDWMFSVKHTVEAVDFPKNQSWLCRYCEYAEFCQKGETYMLLPKNERRNIEKVEKKVVWLYGPPFSGKTTFANKFPDPLMLNSDGNIKFVDAPYIAIKDKIEVTGRMTKKTFAWDIVKDVISELEKKQNDFKTIVVDLLEDLYEYCRLWMYDQMGITHESDDSFRAWDKVRTEFLSTLKRLIALDYENIILISHEDASKDITKKGGDKLTSIKPNLQDKVATKVAGMVDIVARVVADGDVRILSFKSNEVIFGGGRLTTKTNEIALDYDAFLEVYDEANRAAVASMTSNKAVSEVKPSKGTIGATKVETVTDEENMKSDSVSEPETKDAEQALVGTEPMGDLEPQVVNVEPVEEAPKTRTRTRRTRS